VNAGREELADGCVVLTRRGRVCEVLLNRPEALNSLTMPMYDALRELCGHLRSDPTARVVIVRGAGDRALAAGTDIAEFTGFADGEDGVRYERRIGAALQAVEDLPQVTIAAIRGLAVGGGLALATVCDLRVASRGSRIGYPIAATLGNSLSLAALRRCVQVFGESLVREMLLTARLIEIDRAYAAGAVALVTDEDSLDDELAALAARTARLAPKTQQATKQLLAAIVRNEAKDDTAELRRAYGSKDFHEAVTAFVQRRREGLTFSPNLDLSQTPDAPE
jgi:enoyl-CoA hydratase